MSSRSIFAIAALSLLMANASSAQESAPAKRVISCLFPFSDSGEGTNLQSKKLDTPIQVVMTATNLDASGPISDLSYKESDARLSQGGVLSQIVVDDETVSYRSVGEPPFWISLFRKDNSNGYRALAVSQPSNSAKAQRITHSGRCWLVRDNANGEVFAKLLKDMAK